MSPHEEFLELCAVSTSGELTEEERRKLDEHLLGCASCRKALEQFQQTGNTAVPAIAAKLTPDVPEVDKSWSPDKAEAALFERLSREDSQAKPRPIRKGPIESSDPAHHGAYFPSRFDGQMWMSYAAGVLLFLALAISAYRVGIHREIKMATNAPATTGKGSSPFEEQLSDLSHERETLRAQVASRDEAVADLKKLMERLKQTGAHGL